MSSTRFIALALVLMASCSPRDDKAGEESTNGSSETEANDSVAMAASAATAGANDMDTTVAWTERIKKQWGAMAERLVTPAAGPSEAIIEGVSGAPSTVVVHEEPSLVISEWGLPDGADPKSPLKTVALGDPASWERFWRKELRFDGALPENPFVYFKNTGVKRDGAEGLRTEQRLTARGRNGAGHDVWTAADLTAHWTLDEENEKAILNRVDINGWRQVERRTEGASWFEDIAPAVLGAEPAWSQQLAEGMNAWVRRMDKVLRPDFLGYHGLAVNDVNGDGLEDVYLCQPGGLPNLLLLQQADGQMRDVASAAGVDWLENTTSALLVDFDNDGDPDLALATQRGFFVMENDGSGKFGMRSRLTELANGYSPSAADVDNDGDLDLLVLRYGSAKREVGDFPTPHPFYDARNGGANVLLENRGAFQFQDVTAARGLDVGNHRYSFAATWEDYDNDGDSDLYVANDFGPNQLYRNDNGRLMDVSVDSQTQDWGFGMSAAWGDYDRDGRMDLYVSSMFSGAGSQVVPLNPMIRGEVGEKYLKMVRGNTLLRNQGDGRFDDVTNLKGEGFAGWAWGAPFVDLNNDGWEDLYVANGYVSQPDTDDL